jgi:FAD/FMN-containing dehydrogenase
MTSSVGGTLGVGGIDVNSARLGCSADQAISLQVVTPTGEIVECSDSENAELFQRVILGYGQFGVITEATLKIRPYTPLAMHYYYYSTLREAIEDLQMLDAGDASDYSGILTIMDCAVNLLVAFDSAEREVAFKANWERRLRGHGSSASRPCSPNSAVLNSTVTAAWRTAPWSSRARCGSTGVRATW